MVVVVVVVVGVCRDLLQCRATVICCCIRICQMTNLCLSPNTGTDLLRDIAKDHGLSNVRFRLVRLDS